MRNHTLNFFFLVFSKLDRSEAEMEQAASSSLTCFVSKTLLSILSVVHSETTKEHQRLRQSRLTNEMTDCLQRRSWNVPRLECPCRFAELNRRPHGRLHSCLSSSFDAVSCSLQSKHQKWESETAPEAVGSCCPTNLVAVPL